MKKRNILFSPPDITEKEIEKVSEVLRSGWITTGPVTKEFEKKIALYCGTESAVCLNSATACAEIALRLLGIGPGDEVITTAYTYTATASIIYHVGAKIVLVDVQKDSYQMDYNKLESLINENTKAILPVDLAGIPCDYDVIFDIIDRKRSVFRPANEIQEAIGRVAVVADGAHAFGATWHGKKVGSIADFTSFSFHAVKNLTTAEGGALTWKAIAGISSENIYKKCMLFSLHGQSKDALAKTRLGAWEYDIVAPYYKCNMTDIMAAIGSVQLSRYSELLAKRKKIIQKYDDRLSSAGVDLLEHYTSAYESSGHLYLVRVPGKEREEMNRVIEALAKEGIAANVHYKPLPMLTAYKNLGFKIEDYPNAYEMFKNEVSLPLHTLLSDEDVEYVLDTFLDCIYN